MVPRCPQHWFHCIVNIWTTSLCYSKYKLYMVVCMGCRISKIIECLIECLKRKPNYLQIDLNIYACIAIDGCCLYVVLLLPGNVILFITLRMWLKHLYFTHLAI